MDAENVSRGNSQGQSVEPATEATDALRDEFMAWLPDAVIVQKLTGFIRAHRATVLETSPSQVRLQIGKKGLLPWRSGSGESFPLEVRFELDWEAVCPHSMTRVVVEIHPLVENMPADILRSRHDQLLEEIRDFFMAEDLERRLAHRTPIEFPVEVWPILPGSGEPQWDQKYEGEGQDISKTGLSFLVDREIGSGEVFLELYVPGSEGVVCARAEIVRSDKRAEKFFYGARFLSKELKWPPIQSSEAQEDGGPERPGNGKSDSPSTKRAEKQGCLFDV